MAYLSVWRGLPFWPVRAGSVSSNGLDLQPAKGVRFMIAGLSMRHSSSGGFLKRRLARHFFAALLALAVIGAAKPVLAQTAAAPSPNAILIAKQIIEIKGVKKLFEPLVRGVVEKVKNQFMQTNFMWAKDLNEVADQLTKEYEPRTSELVDESARIYASHFTEAELKQILAFYQTPVGRKVIVEEPKALDQSVANAGIFGDKLSEEIINKFRDEMKKRGHDI
jgi:uncharacterized protein